MLFLVESEILNHKDRIEQFMLTERRKDTSMHLALIDCDDRFLFIY